MLAKCVLGLFFVVVYVSKKIQHVATSDGECTEYSQRTRHAAMSDGECTEYSQKTWHVMMYIRLMVTKSLKLLSLSCMA